MNDPAVESYCICARWRPEAEASSTNWERWTKDLSQQEAISEGKKSASFSWRLIEFGLFVRPPKRNQSKCVPALRFVKFI